MFSRTFPGVTPRKKRKKKVNRYVRRPQHGTKLGRGNLLFQIISTVFWSVSESVSLRRTTHSTSTKFGAVILKKVFVYVLREWGLSNFFLSFYLFIFLSFYLLSFYLFNFLFILFFFFFLYLRKKNSVELRKRPLESKRAFALFRFDIPTYQTLNCRGVKFC